MRAQRLRQGSRGPTDLKHRQWAMTANSSRAPAEEYTAMTVLSSGRKHLDRLWLPSESVA